MTRRVIRKENPSKRSSKNVAKNPLNPGDNHEEIQKVAYELYKRRDSAHGNDWGDWFEAEKIIMSNN
ncbi:MAG: DUF2934 domain-containing protein [Deltaproteobacteria bacterium]|nr:MAG: DUF2934 domain-containing protein [Deltaproteobacteria bacterium]